MTERQVRRAQGFCGAHAWWLLGESASRAIRAEAVWRSLAHVLIDALAALASYGGRDPEARLDPSVFKRTVRHAWTRKVARRLAPAGSCPLCLLSKRIQETLGYQVLGLLRLDEISVAYGPPSALCLPHFRWALDAAGDKAVLDRLVSTEKARLEALVANHVRLDLEPTLAHVVGARFPIGGR